MSQAWDIFADNYIRNLKRPELFNFNPDGAYGANLLHGSENTNPWAGRDQSNAKYGALGGKTGQSIVQSSSTSQIPSLPGLNINNIPALLPGVPTSPAQNTFAGLMGSIAKPIGDKVATDGVDFIKNLLNGTNIGADVVGNAAEMGGGYGKLAGEMIGASTSGDAYAGIGERLTRESTKRLSDAINGVDTSSTFGFDPTSIAIAAAPQLAKMFGLKGTAGDAVGAAAGVGSAALQGGMNPVADVGALMSLVKLFGGLF